MSYTVSKWYACSPTDCKIKGTNFYISKYFKWNMYCIKSEKCLIFIIFHYSKKNKCEKKSENKNLPVSSLKLCKHFNRFSESKQVSSNNKWRKQFFFYQLRNCENFMGLTSTVVSILWWSESFRIQWSGYLNIGECLNKNWWTIMDCHLADI